jgi:YesN/AraC family two-component response regulator
MPEKALWVMADTSATMKVLNNLVYNAIKYTDSYIEIELAEGEDGCVTLSVANDGNIIPADMRERIFRTFVQYNPGQNESKEGFGIGLSVAKTLAELQHGSLHMTEDHDVNKFVLSLPVTESPAETTVEDETAHETVSDISVNERRSTVLVVEDHPELLEYIRKTLSRHYNILTAPNGAKAFETIKSQSNIDLVLTDLKMPEMSGMELCKKIKQDPTFSHILLIILSANLTPETKIESLKNGADAIIEKPFSMDFLELRIESLINSRKQLIEKISNNHEYEEENQDDSNDGLSARDIVFLRELNVCVEENFNDPDFGVEELAAQLNISRSSLNRKMRDILDTTANNYIRDKKIEKAEELLRTSSMQINEICYKVGFTTPSYFIKCFRKKYGMSPNEYANSNH